MRVPRCFIFLIYLAALASGSCESMVDVPLPPEEPRLVAQGFFSPAGPWAARVSHTVGYGDAADPGFMEDAIVEVWEEGQRLVRLVRTDTGTYASTSPLPAPGKTYTLRVAVPGYAPVEGRSALPPAHPAPRFAETSEARGDGADARRRVSHVALTLDDPGGITNYYSLFVVHVRWQEDRQAGTVRALPPSLFGFESDDLALGDNPLDFLNTGKTRYVEALFTDETFDGQTYTIDFDLQYDLPDEAAQVVTRRGFAVVLLSVSESFYKYWKTTVEQAVAGNNPFSEPLRIYSNMAGGFGVFASYRAYVFPVQGSSTAVAQPAMEYLCDRLGFPLPLCSAPADTAAASGNEKPLRSGK